MSTPGVGVHAPVEVRVGTSRSAVRLEDCDQNMTSVDVVVDRGLGVWIVKVAIGDEVNISA